MTELACFAVAAPGLEPITARELQRLRLRITSQPSADAGRQDTGRAGPGEEAGGVEFAGSLRDVYRANLHLRTATRVLVRLGEFYAAAFSELRKKASRLPWEEYLTPAQPVALRVTCHKSKLYHSDAVAERVAGAIEDCFGQGARREAHRAAADASPAAQLIVVRLVHDRCTISLDSSGAMLHQRGYRLATTKAPLRETLAAGMLLACGWDPAVPLLDPFCGSGTIPIEAALLAKKLAPGRARRFAFMDWPGFDSRLWQALRAEAERPAAVTLPPILASDRDGGAIEAARANAARAGVADCIEFSRRAISAVEPPPGPGWVVTNPPYGVRVGRSGDLRNLYAQLGHVLRARCPGWQVALLCGSAKLAHCVGLDFDRGLPLVNGGLRVRLLQTHIPPPQA